MALGRICPCLILKLIDTRPWRVRLHHAICNPRNRLADRQPIVATGQASCTWSRAIPEKARRLLGDRAQVFGADVSGCQGCRSHGPGCRLPGHLLRRGRHRRHWGPVLLPAPRARSGTFCTYQELVNVVEAARANGFGGRVRPAVGHGGRSPSLAGAILNAIKGDLPENMVDRERYLEGCGLD